MQCVCVCVCVCVCTSVCVCVHLLEYYRYTDLVDEDDGIDKAKALLVAARGSHFKVVESILIADLSVLYVQLCGMETWKIAVQDGLSCIFEV